MFKRTFGHAPTHLIKAPARLELLGSHAEWNDGLALTVAIDRHLCLAAAPRTDGRIELVSSAYPQRERFWLSDLAANPEAPWTALVKAVLRELRIRGVHFGGFSAVVHSEIPPGAGLGSSGALLAATALLSKIPQPTDADIDTHMSGNLCRCATYNRIRTAIKQAASGTEKKEG